MKDINIVLIAGPVDMVHIHGEPMLDTDEGSLVIQGEEGAFAHFRLSNIAYYTVAHIEENDTNGYI